VTDLARPCAPAAGQLVGARRRDLQRLGDFGAPEAIKHIREQSHMSQATFARALNVSTVLISKWERGEVRPSGPLRIPTKPATHSNRKPATDSDLKPAGVPI